MTMNDFGRYRLTYVPTPDYSAEYVEPSIEMAISAEASLSDMCRFFDSFLKAAGYIYEGSLEVGNAE